VRHRADIDGLRAIAVVAVVLFHAGVSQVSGGFVGVDIFFVISGYLITSLLLGEIAEGRFSLAGFYERRIRRIFPALFAVLAFCMAVATILFLPRELQNFDQSLLATTFFVSNIYFYSTTGYFAAQPDSLPLLHTWSLSIEEQFYIVFPLLLSLAIGFGRRVWVWLIAALFLLSLAASIWVTKRRRGCRVLSRPDARLGTHARRLARREAAAADRGASPARIAGYRRRSPHCLCRVLLHPGHALPRLGRADPMSRRGARDLCRRG
jgi:peptidoglycan/LPS O-acetylase OafA/YrhL